MPIQIDLGSSTPRKAPVKQGRVVGIDLGTTNSLVAIERDGRPYVIVNPSENPLLPSVVTLSDDGRFERVGEAAKAERALRPRNAIFSAKRLLGRSLKDLGAEASELPFALVDDPASGQVRIQAGGHSVSPIEVSAEILKALKTRAERALGEKVERAVVTVPAYFDDAQRTATKAAGRLAGLEVLRVLNEPTAAALAYGWNFERPGTVVIYDLGGGTFDVSVLRLEANVLEVLSTHGDTRLGGDDLDRALANEALKRLVAARPQNRSEDAQRTLQASLLREAERVKRELSSTNEAVFHVADFEWRITRAEAESFFRPFVERTLDSVRQALADARLSPADIDDVLLVGGSTRVPLVRELVGEFFGRKPNASLDPDEAVALGAARQAATLEGSGGERLLLDVIPLSLGIETVGGAVAKLIHRNSTIPTEARDVYTNHAEKQTAFDIHVLQGERELVRDCRSLARFKLRGLTPAPPGFHRIEVVFRIDASGILNVRAKDLRSGKAHEIEVRPTFGLTDDEVVQMLESSFDKAEEDIAIRQLVDARVEAEGVVRATEKALANSSHLLSALEKSEVRARLVDLQNSLGGSNADNIRRALSDLDAVSRDFAEAQVNEALKKALSGTQVD